LTSDALSRPLGLLVALALLGLAPLTLPSCTEDSAGIEVPVAYRGELLADAPIDTADAQRVRLTSAHVAVEALELWACPETTLARAVRLLGPSVARAHTAASPTRIGVPVVLDGLSDEALRPGTFRPTPGAYCGLRGMLAMPDDDALGADPSAPLNAAVELSGERLGPDGEVLGTFSLRSTMSVSFEWTFAEPLVLDASAPYAEAWVVLDAAAWMAATALPEGELDAAGASALSQAAADALRLELVRPGL
jgi:hypothetical protein